MENSKFYTPFAQAEQYIQEDFAVFLEALQRKDDKAWGQLYEWATVRLLPLMQHKISGTQNSDTLAFSWDVFSHSLTDFFIVICESSKTLTFSNISDVSKYIMTIAGNHIQALNKNNTKNIAYHSPIDDYWAMMPSEWWENFEKSTENSKKYRTEKEFFLEKALESISEKDQKLLMENICEGRTLADIAFEMNLNQATVRKRKERALERLQAQFYHFLNTTKHPALFLWILTTIMKIGSIFADI